MIRATFCCVCGLRHLAGNCAAFDHLGRCYTDLRNEMDALKKGLRKKRKR